MQGQEQAEGVLDKEDGEQHPGGHPSPSLQVQSRPGDNQLGGGHDQRRDGVHHGEPGDERGHF